MIALLGAARAVALGADDGLSVLTNPGATPAAPDPMAQANAAIARNPNDPTNYILRGNIYGRQKQYDQARLDYNKALQIDPQNVAAKILVADSRFLQKQYDQARPGFVAMQGDPDMGDLASFMVFLCDLVSGHEDAAGKELAAFNAAGENPSYYYANVAWAVLHHDMAGASDYLRSAIRIYAPSKSALYTVNLEEIGYLPLKN
jgi:Tfp pilus assembly protein PilF